MTRIQAVDASLALSTSTARNATRRANSLDIFRRLVYLSAGWAPFARNRWSPLCFVAWLFSVPSRLARASRTRRRVSTKWRPRSCRWRWSRSRGGEDRRGRRVRDDEHARLSTTRTAFKIGMDIQHAVIGTHRVFDEIFASSSSSSF